MALFKFGDYLITDFEPWIERGFTLAKRVLEVNDRNDCYDFGDRFNSCYEGHLRYATEYEISLSKAIDNSLILETTRNIYKSEFKDGMINISSEKVPVIYVFPN